jgi:hypothetical protein
MKNNIHFWIAHFFLEWKGFQTNVLEKFKTYTVCSITFFFFFRKSYRLWDNVEKYGTAGQATNDNMEYGAGALHAVYLRLQAQNV